LQQQAALCVFRFLCEDVNPAACCTQCDGSRNWGVNIAINPHISASTEPVKTQTIHGKAMRHHQLELVLGIAEVTCLLFDNRLIQFSQRMDSKQTRQWNDLQMARPGM
jgi:hypothetical protein